MNNVSKTYYRCAINPEVIQYLQNPISRLLGPMKKHDKFKVAIVREEGSNGEREMASAFYYAGFHPVDVTMTDLMDKKTVKNVLNTFSKNKKSEIITLSTLEKKSISNMKAKLLSYVS